GLHGTSGGPVPTAVPSPGHGPGPTPGARRDHGGPDRASRLGRAAGAVVDPGRVRPARHDGLGAAPGPLPGRTRLRGKDPQRGRGPRPAPEQAAPQGPRRRRPPGGRGGTSFGLPPDRERAPGERLTARTRSGLRQDRKSTRLNSSHVKTSYAVFCLKKKENESLSED